MTVSELIKALWAYPTQREVVIVMPNGDEWKVSGIWGTHDSGDVPVVAILPE